MESRCTKPETEKEHWENIYCSKSEREVSWFQEYPKTSMEFIELFKLPVTANIIDIGGGDSHFVDALLEKGYQNIWVLDISANAIEKAKKDWVIEHQKFIGLLQM